MNEKLTPQQIEAVARWLEKRDATYSAALLRRYGPISELALEGGLFSIHVDPSLPDDVVEIRDRPFGRLLGKIVNLGKS